MSEPTITTAQLVYTFEMFDKNKDGCISADEVSRNEFVVLLFNRVVLLASICMSKTSNARR